MSQEMKKAKAAGSKLRKKPAPTTAFQIESANGTTHVVGIGNLRVVLVDDEGSWFAQGLEIDYFAQGSTVEDAQRRFQSGLRETIDYHLKMYGTIAGLLKVAPQEVWDELVNDQQPGLGKYFSQVSVHIDDDSLAALPYRAIDFYGTDRAVS